LAVGLAQGIALALDLPVVPVSTLAALAAGAPDGRVLAAIDARMGGVYLGRFEVAEGRGVALGRERGGRPGGGGVARAGRWYGGGLAAIDARRGEVYLGRFEVAQGRVVALGRECVARPEAVEVPGDGPWYAVGTGFAAAEGLLQRRLDAVLAAVEAQALPRAA